MKGYKSTGLRVLVLVGLFGCQSTTNELKPPELLNNNSADTQISLQLAKQA